MGRVLLPELEKFLMTFAVGITGLEIYKDFGYIPPELKSFLGYCHEAELNSVDSLFSELKEKEFNKMKELYEDVVSSFRDINTNEIKTDERKLKNLLSKMKEIYDIAHDFYDEYR